MFIFYTVPGAAQWGLNKIVTLRQISEFLAVNFQNFPKKRNVKVRKVKASDTVQNFA